jgi:hypothetical protein
MRRVANPVGLAHVPGSGFGDGELLVTQDQGVVSGQTLYGAPDRPQQVTEGAGLSYGPHVDEPPRPLTRAEWLDKFTE